MEISQPNKYLNLIWLWMALSSIVLIEPSPYDILFVPILGLACLFSYLSFSYQTLPALVFMWVFVDSNLISLFSAGGDVAGASRFFLITLYLCVSWVLFLGLFQRYGQKVLDVIFSGYMVAALIAVSMGILTYFHLIPNADHFLYHGRAMGFFKDANVYGPFLVPPLLFASYRFETTNRIRQFFWLFLVAFLSVGVLLSFSRAAWGNCLIALFLYLLLPPWPAPKVRVRKFVFLLLLLLPVIIFTVSHGDVQELFSSRLGIQSYDSNRFGTQLASVELAVERPLGIGPGQTENILNYSTHSLYIRVLTECGLLGFFSLMGFLLVTMIRSLGENFRLRNPSPYAAIITASLAGVLFNSIFIDTLHWRHFWLLMAMPWIPLERNASHENSADSDQIR